MNIADAHCHLESEEFEGRLDGVLAEARNTGVTQIVTAAVRPEEWAKSKAIASATLGAPTCFDGTLAGRDAGAPRISFAWGIHPWYAAEHHFSDLERLATAAREGAVAIGEIGLDRKIESPAFGLQQRLFEAQLEVACDINLPVVMHCRGAFNELVESLRRVGVPKAGGMIHAFSGSVEMAEICLGLGLVFSMGASLSYKPSKKRLQVLGRIYPDAFLIETDSPDMPPAQAPDKPNVPANIRYNLAGVAAMLGRTEEEVAEVSMRNAGRLFGF